MKLSLLLPLSATLVAGLHAQTYAPVNANTTEQNARNNYPFQRTGGRLQNVIDGSEFTATSFVTTALSLRWDGATAGSGGSATFGSVKIEVGTTPLAWNQASALFAQNRSAGTLRGTFTASAYNFAYPAAITTSPKPWGATDLDGKLRFPFAAPAPMPIPAGGSAFIDCTWSSRTGGTSNALVDFAQDGTAGGMGQGTSVVVGTGCPASATGVPAQLLTASSFPQLSSGTAISFHGTGYAGNAPMVTMIGGSLLPTPILLPGTTSCNIYVALSPLLLIPGTTTATGTFNPYDPGTFLPIPQGIVGTIQVQRASVITPYAGNTLGLQLSNALTLNIVANSPTGTPKGWFAGHHVSDLAEAATFCAFGVFAVRFE